MPRTRQLMSTVLGTFLFLAVAVPALAGPVPVDEGNRNGGSPPRDAASAGFDPGFWAVAGMTAAALLVVAAIAVAAVSLARHAHHAPRPV